MRIRPAETTATNMTTHWTHVLMQGDVSPDLWTGQSLDCNAETATSDSGTEQQRSEEGGRAIPGAAPAMTSPFSNWAGSSDAESQVNQARMKALGKRRKSNKKIALEVVEEADKEGEEGVFVSCHTSPNIHGHYLV